LFVIASSNLVVLDSVPEQEQHLLWLSIAPFVFFLLHLQFCVYTTPLLCFFTNFTTLLYVAITPLVPITTTQKDVCEFCARVIAGRLRCIVIFTYKNI